MGPADAAVLAFQAAEDVAAADDNPHLHAQFADALDLARHFGQDGLREAVAAGGIAQDFPAEFQKDAPVFGFFHRSSFHGYMRCPGTEQAGGSPSGVPS